MPKGISNDGGIDTSELKEIKDFLMESIKIQKDINNITVKPKGDDSGLKPVRKSLETIKKEINEIDVNDDELWNTKTIQKAIKSAQDEIDKLKKATHGFLDEFDNNKQITKFISNFKLLETYGKRFGKDLISDYKNAFDSLMNRISDAFINKKSYYDTGQYLGFTPNKINELINKEEKSAKNNVKIDIDYALNTDIAKIKKAQYDEERRLAIESANEVERAERQKREAMLQTRDVLIDNIKNKLLDIKNSANDNQYLDIDEKSFGIFQKQAGDLLITLEKMGVETKDLGELLSQIGNKVYVPSDQINDFKSNIINSSLEVKNLKDEIRSLEDMLSRSIGDGYELDKANRELTDAKYQIQSLEEEVSVLQDELSHSVNWFDWSQKVDEVEQLTHKIHELEEMINNLRLDNEILELDNRDLQALDKGQKNLEEEKQTGRDIVSINKEIMESKEELLDSQNNSSYLFNTDNFKNIENTLRLIAEHLNEIKLTLGSVNESSGFKNIITNVDILLIKLDEMYQKIGNGTYNASINTSGSYGSPADSIISREREKMMSAYNQIIDAFGEESLMYTEVANTLNVGIDEFKSVYGRDTILGTSGEKNQLNLLRGFFQRFDEYRKKSIEYYENYNDKIQNDLNDLNEGNEIRISEKINYQNRRNKKSDIYTLKHNDVGIEKIDNVQKAYRISGLEKQRAYNIQKLDQLNKLAEIGNGFLDEDTLNKEIMEVTDSAQKSMDELKNKSNEILDNINNKLSEIKDEIINLSNSDILDKPFDSLISKLDDIILRFDNIISKIETIDLSSIDFHNHKKDINISNIKDQDLKNDKQHTVDQFKSEGEAAGKAAKQINSVNDALDKYIRKQSGDVSTGNYNYTQAINKIVDKDVQIRTDKDGDEKKSELMRVNYDKLSKEILKTDTEIFKLQQQINNTTQGNTTGLQKNLSILQTTKKIYEDLLDTIIQDPQYIIDDSQIQVLNQQRNNNLQFLQNIQDTKDSIKQLKVDKQTISLGFDKEIKNNELVDYVDKLKDLGVYSKQAEQEAIRLSNVLSQVGSKDELSNYNKQFKIFQQNYASSIEGNKNNVNALIKEQLIAYKNIWEIRKQISKLDLNKDSNLILELKNQEQEQKNIYITKIQELDAINHQIAHEQVLNNYANIRKKTELEIRNIKASQNDDDIKNRFNSIISKYGEIKKLNSEIQNLVSSGVSDNDTTIADRNDKINDLRTEISLISKLGFTTEQLVDIKNAENKATQVLNDSRAKQNAKIISEQQQIEKTRNSLLKEASALLTNGKFMKMYGNQVNNMIKELENTGVAKERLEELRIELMKIKTEANISGQTGKTFGQILKQRFTSLGAYIGSFVSFYKIIDGVRRGFSVITELDNQLVDLRKTTKMNTDELEDFYYSSNDVAKQLGVTTSEIISQASAWSRLGYSTKEASKEMAKLSSKFTSISPGMSTDNATDYLVSTMQAYSVKVDEVERKILDNVNRIGNTFATTNAEIGEMLTRSSAAMHEANNTLEQTIALESAAVQITRNAETTGTAFRTVSMRIRGFDEETEELSTDLENIAGDLADLTKINGQGGIKIFTDESRTEYKSTYQILKELADIWDDLTDKQHADILEKIAGKRGGQVISGLLNNFGEVERAMTEMEGAAGSAESEMKIIQESLGFKINAFKQTWIGMLQKSIDRGDIGNWVDGLTNLSKGLDDVIDKFGIFKSLIVSVAGVLGSKKLG